MYLFDKRFVHFMWNDKLKGKKCFLEDEIDVLRVTVEKGVESDLHSIVFSRNESAPFRIADGLYNWQFAYYDPNYEVKKAFNKGKKVQVRCAVCSWKDCDEPKWYDDCAYRVKPDCPCEDGIDPKACVGCEHSEDGKPEYKPYETVEEFIQDYQERFPTAVPRPACTMPLIWLTNIVSEEIHLVTGFNMTDENENEKGVCIRDIIWSFRELFSSWTFLDGSPCGKEC